MRSIMSNVIRKQQAIASRRRRKRPWLQQLLASSSNLATQKHAAHDQYNDETRVAKHNEVEEVIISQLYDRATRTNKMMVAISTLCTIIACCIISTTTLDTCHAAPSALDLVNKLATHRDHSTSLSSLSPSSLPSSSPPPSHLVKSARLATYSLSCPPEASIHPCTCIYHTPGAQVEEEEEVYELSPAITTPYAESLVMTSTPTPAVATTTTPQPPPPTTVTTPPPSTVRQLAIASTTSTTTTSTTTSTVAPSPPLSTTTTTSTISASISSTQAPASSSTTITTSAAPTQSEPVPNDERANPSRATPSTIGGEQVSVTSTTSTTTLPPPSSKTPLEGGESHLLMGVVGSTNNQVHSGSQDWPSSNHTSKMAVPQQGQMRSQAETTTSNTTTIRPSVPLKEPQAFKADAGAAGASGDLTATLPSEVIRTNSSSGFGVKSQAASGRQESRNGVILVEANDGGGSNNSSRLSSEEPHEKHLDTARGAGGAVVGQHEQQQWQQLDMSAESKVKEELPLEKNPATSHQKMPAQQSLDSSTAAATSGASPPPPLPGHSEQSLSSNLISSSGHGAAANSNMTNVNQTGKQTNLTMVPNNNNNNNSAEEAKLPDGVIAMTPAAQANTNQLASAAASSATVAPLPLVVVAIGTTTSVTGRSDIPLRLTPSSTATIWTETRPVESAAGVSSGGGSFVFVGDTLSSTTPMPLQTSVASQEIKQIGSGGGSTTTTTTTTVRPDLNLLAHATSAPLQQPSVGNDSKVGENQITKATNESGAAESAGVVPVASPGSSSATTTTTTTTTSTTAAAPTDTTLGLEDARHKQQEVATSPRPVSVSSISMAVVGASGVQTATENNPQAVAAPAAVATLVGSSPSSSSIGSISSSGSSSNELTKHDYNVVSVAGKNGDDSQWPKTTMANGHRGGERLDQVVAGAGASGGGGGGIPTTSPPPVVTVDTSAAMSTSTTTTTAPAMSSTSTTSSPSTSVTNQSSDTHANSEAAASAMSNSNSSERQGSRQHSAAATGVEVAGERVSSLDKNLDFAAAARASVDIAKLQQQQHQRPLISANLDSNPAQQSQQHPSQATGMHTSSHATVHSAQNSSSDTAAWPTGHQNHPASAPTDQTNPPAAAAAAAAAAAHRHANNGALPTSNSSAPRTPGERPASDGRAIHHPRPASGGGGTSNANTANNNQHHQHQHQNTSQARLTGAHGNNQQQQQHNHQSFGQNGRQILTPNTHKPRPASNRTGHHPKHQQQHPNSNHSQHINSSAATHNQTGNQTTNSLGAQSNHHHNQHNGAPPQAVGAGARPLHAQSASSASPPLIRSTRSAGNPSGGASGNRSHHQQSQRLRPNTLAQPNRQQSAGRPRPAAAASRGAGGNMPHVLVTSAPHLDPRFSNATASSQRAPGGRRLTRFLAHGQESSANLLSSSDPFADASEQKVEVVAYCRNIQNSQVLRSAIKGFRGHQINYFVIDSCKVPPFPNDLFHGIDVRWLEMSNSTVQFHNNFLHGAHHNHHTHGQLSAP